MNQSSKMKEKQKVVYGVGDCHPQALQCLANPKAFTANIAVIMFLKVCIFSYAVGMIRTLEKRFSLSSQQIGVLSSINDIVEVFVVLCIGYFAGKAHKPRMLGISLVILSLGSFMYAIPYFAFGTKENIISRKSTGQDNLVCDQSNVNDSSITCHKTDAYLLESNNSAFIMFACAGILMGLGGSGLQVLGISYIDENVKHENVALYLGFATACYPLGPVAGFLSAGLATSFPENLKSSALENTDPAFIGAWWLGYTIYPCLLFVFCITLFFFPKHFPEYYIQKKRRNTAIEKEGSKHHTSEANRIHTSSGVLSMIWRELKEFPKSLMRMMSKPEYVTNMLTNIFGVYMIIGLVINLTRYIETYFLQPASIANVFTAVSGPVPAVIGTVLAGIIVHRLKLSLQGKALMSAITHLAAIVGIASLMFLTCDQVDLAGQRNDNGLLDVDLPCAMDCTCPKALYLPVCGETSTGDSQKMTFLSPCHAGCQSLNGSWKFSNCSCLATPFETTNRGPCSPPCKIVYVYIAVMSLMTLVGSMGRVPATIVSLRVVDPELRTFALGFQSFLINLLAFIPGPIFFGTLIDSTCLVWTENCGQKGNCLFYDTTKYRLLMHGVTLAFMFISSIFAALTWFLIRRNTKKGVYDEVDNIISSTEVEKHENSMETTAGKQNTMNKENGLKLDNGVNNNILSNTQL